jgi:hypothetical protein
MTKIDSMEENLRRKENLRGKENLGGKENRPAAD